jgi:hypothetical protein
MSKVIELAKRFNDRWKIDPLFIKNFDYDQPKYADVRARVRRLLPLAKPRPKRTRIPCGSFETYHLDPLLLKAHVF